jgi:hypothetical protein
MNYSSYLGSKKCDKVICTRGPPGPPGPPGKILNTFTIISSPGINDDTNNRITWIIDIPFIYGRQFTFTFYTFNIDVQPLYIDLPQIIDTNNTYFFGTGQSVYQSYIVNGTSNLNNVYVLTISSFKGSDIGTDFEIITNVDNNGILTYKFVYTYDSSKPSYQHYIDSKIKLNGIKYN